MELIDYTSYGAVAEPVGIPYYQSLYYDTEGDLILLRTNTDNNLTELICIEITESDDVLIFNSGVFDDDFWAIGGIHEKNAAVVFDYPTMIYGDSPEWEWDPDHTQAKANFTGPDSAQMTAEAQITSETKAPTCEDDGVIVYKATVVIGMKTYTNEQSVFNTAALGHDFGEWTLVTPATYFEEGLEQCVCSRDESHVETRAIPKLTPVPGDVNGDDKVNAKDVVLMLRYLTGWKDENVLTEAMDFDGNKKVNVKDAIGVMRSII